MQGYLLAKLGLPPERVLRLQTLELGALVTEEVERGVRSSRVTMVVLSSAYMGDRWAAFGQQLAADASAAKEPATGSAATTTRSAATTGWVPSEGSFHRWSFEGRPG